VVNNLKNSMEENSSLLSLGKDERKTIENPSLNKI
jgi:hypothetical protein